MTFDQKCFNAAGTQEGFHRGGGGLFRRNSGRSSRLIPGQEQLLLLTEAFGPDLKFTHKNLEDDIFRANFGSILMRGLVEIEKTADPAATDIPEAPGKPDEKPGTDLPLRLKVTDRGRQYLLNPPPLYKNRHLWSRLPYGLKNRLMVLAALAVTWMAVKVWNFFF